MFARGCGFISVGCACMLAIVLGAEAPPHEVQCNTQTEGSHALGVVEHRSHRDRELPRLLLAL